MRLRAQCQTYLLCLAILTIRVQRLQAQGQATPDASAGKAAQSPVSESKDQSSAAKPDALRQLEDDLFRSFKTPPAKGPLNPSPELPRSAPPVNQGKRARDLSDQRKDWVFMKPEEMMAVPTVEDLLNLPPVDKDGRPKEKLSPLESYLDRLYHPDEPNQQNGRTERSRELNPFPWDKKSDTAKETGMFGEGPEQDEIDLPNSVRETQRNLKKRLSESEQGFGSLSAPRSHSFFSDVFGLDVKAKELASPQELEAQKQRMQQLKALYGFQAAPPTMADPSNPLMGLVQFGSEPAKVPTVSSSPALPAYPSGRPGVIGLPPLPDPNELPGVAKLLAPQSGFGSPLPKPEQPKLAPPTPNFNAPRRVF